MPYLRTHINGKASVDKISCMNPAHRPNPNSEILQTHITEKFTQTKKQQQKQQKIPS